MVSMLLFWGLLIFLDFYLMKNYMNGTKGFATRDLIDILIEWVA